MLCFARPLHFLPSLILYAVFRQRYRHFDRRRHFCLRRHLVSITAPANRNICDHLSSLSFAVRLIAKRRANGADLKSYPHGRRAGAGDSSAQPLLRDA
jgi:hypothetical protein